MQGNAGNDRLDGGKGDDFLSGGDGDDTLIGGKGDDTMQSGDGADTFVFSGGGGQDVVLDFKAGEDLLQISRNINGLHIRTADDLASRVSDDHGNAVIDLGHGDTITLVGVNAADVQDNPNQYFTIG